MPSIDQLPSGKFRVRHQGRSATFSTRAEADQAAARFTLGIDLLADLTTLAPSLAPTFSQALPSWLASRTAIQADTARSNEVQLRIHVLPTFRDTPLDKIDREAVGVWQADLEKRLSPKSVRNIRSIFRRMMKDSGYDPFSTVRSPRLDRDGMLEIVPMSLDVIDDIVASARPDWAPFLRLLAYSGMRPGEAYALKDIDLRDKAIRIERALKNDLTIGAPKNAASRRTISLDSVTLDMLRTRPVSPGGWLFAGPRSDKPVSPGWIDNRLWTPLVANLPQRPRLYDLRHNHAAQLLDNGMPLALVSQRLGHSDQTTTVKVYNRLHRPDDSQVLDYLESLNSGSRKHLRAV